MRVQINLASRPFVELRPFFLRLRLIMAALAVAGLAIALTAHFLSVKAARQQLELDQLRNQTIRAQQSKLHVEQRMRDPVNARVLDRAHFLNALFLRKSFSWTAVMMDGRRAWCRRLVDLVALMCAERRTSNWCSFSYNQEL